jgi:4-hydroxy-tetrahydrodipicolinate synthase
MSSRKFKGTGVAIITPFKNGEVDYRALTKVVNHLINGKVDYLVPLGSSGESAMLSNEEQKKILKHVIKVNKGRKPIVAGNFGGKNTAEQVVKIKSYNFKGIDAILSSSPEYIKPSQEGIYRHYMELANASPVPIILYNVPGRTKSNMEWETTIRLAKASKKFVGIKEASGDLIQTTQLLKHRPKRFLIISGDDEVVLPMIALGGDGVISVIGNVLPGKFSSMIKAGLKGDLKTARALNNEVYDLHKWLYIEGNPVGIKAAMEVKGLCSKEVRLPLSEMSEGNYAGLRKCLLGILPSA